MGTYLHGLFASDAYRRSLLAGFGIEGGATDYRRSVDAALDGVADELARLLDPRWLDALLA